MIWKSNSKNGGCGIITGGSTNSQSTYKKQKNSNIKTAASTDYLKSLCGVSRNLFSVFFIQLFRIVDPLKFVEVFVSLVGKFSEDFCSTLGISGI